MKRITLCLLGVVLVVAACVKDPVTGRRELILVSEAEEIAMGRQAAGDVDASMGLYEDEELTAYVEELGLRIARSSERPDLPWRFRVVDSPIVNAFALPGGYIYFTRGILAHMSSEAALMGVMGHEIGHVTARHSVEQISKQQLAGLGLNLGGVFLPEIRPYGQILGSGLSLLFLKFGRDAERESDTLGVRYSLAQGYDPTEMARFFSVLDRLSGPEGRVPGWASTHPDPLDREATILAQVALEAPDRPNLRVNRDSFLDRVDGIVYGENPREGFMREGRFLHPDLAFQIDFPDGWAVQNTKTLVYASEPDRGAAIQLTLSQVEPGVEPAEYAREFFRRNQLEYGTGERLRVGPFPAYRAPFRARTRGGTIYGQAGFIADGGRIYEVVGLTRSNALQRYTPTFHAVIDSFDRLEDESALGIQPLRIGLYELPRAMSLSEALAAAGMETDRHEELSILNNTELDAPLDAGTRIKVLRRGGP